MNANLKSIVGAAVAALALAMVACGKSGGGNNNGNGVNCVQVGASCVAMPPGYISNGLWSGKLYNGNVGTVEVSVRLSSNGGGGYGGGYGGGGYGYPGYGSTVGMAAVQTIATVTIRTGSTVIQGTGIANGSVGGFSTSISASTQYGPTQINLSGSFVDGTQRGMQITTSGAIAVGGLITGQPNNQGAGGGYGYGGGNLGGGYGYPDPGYGSGAGGYGYGYPFDPYF